MYYVIPIVAIVLIFSPKLVSEVKDYLLKKEQIKVDAELKAEALRLKNSLDLEKFINDSNNVNETTYNQTNQNGSNYYNNQSNYSNPNNSDTNSSVNDDSFDRVKRKTNNI